MLQCLRPTAVVYSLPIKLDTLDEIYDLESHLEDGVRVFSDKSHSHYRKKMRAN